MLILGLLCVHTALAVVFKSTTTDNYINWFNEWFTFEAGFDRVITGIDSYHENHSEDRRWRFYTATADGLKCRPLSWTDYKNGFDGELHLSCGENQALNAVRSEHSDEDSDRRFKFRCCDITSGGKYYIDSVHHTHLLHSWDKVINEKCNPNSVMVGLTSYHNNHHEDRIWAFKCGIVQEGKKPIVTYNNPQLSPYINSFHHEFYYTTPMDKFMKNRRDGWCFDARNPDVPDIRACDANQKTQEWTYNEGLRQIKNGNGMCLYLRDNYRPKTATCDPSDEHQQWKYDPRTGHVEGVGPNARLCVAPYVGWGVVLMRVCERARHPFASWDLSPGGHQAMVGIKSYHDNGKEDRRWQAWTVSTPGLACWPNNWTEFQNENDAVLDFACPHNQIMAGFAGVWSKKNKDRRFRFRCCDVSASDFTVSNVRQTGLANWYDNNLDHACARNEVMVGIHSQHDNKKEDRIWTVKCGTLTKNEPDWDDCTEVTVVDAQIGEVQSGGRKTVEVAEYTTWFEACGNSNAPSMNTLYIENQKSESKTETLELSRSLEESFLFSATLETTLKLSTSVTAAVNGAVASSSVTNSLEFGLKTAFTTETGVTMSSSETKATATEDVKVNVVTSESVFQPEPYQWREVRASYIEQEVTVPLRLKAQCKRKDGKKKEVWIESTVTAAAHSQINVSFNDRTAECKNSYYKNCECVPGLQSDFLSDHHCQVHPFMPGHPGCYVYKGANCGNGQGLGASKPQPAIPVCDDPERCPNGGVYYDYPLDPYVWEWSYVPCGGERKYPGDPGYSGPEYEDMVEKVDNKHCYDGYTNGGSLGGDVYSTRISAIIACDNINRKTPGTCYGVYDTDCDSSGKFYLCSNDMSKLKSKGDSCIWKMQDQYTGRGRRLDTKVDELDAPFREEMHAVERNLKEQ